MIAIATKKNLSLTFTGLHRAEKIPSNFDNEVKQTKEKYKSAGFPVNFTNSMARQFNEPRVEKIIPNFLFEEGRDLFFRLPCCPKSEKLLGCFIKQLHGFTNERYNFKVF